jgi:hypothetical protein
VDEDGKGSEGVRSSPPPRGQNMRARRPLAALLVAPLLSLTAALLTGQAAPLEATPPHGQEHTAYRTELGPIDTTSRQAVRDAYRRLWVRGDESRPRWIDGSVEDCRPGRLADSSTRRQLDALNFAREMAGLAPVTLDAEAVPGAQAAALIMTAEQAVSHAPPQDWPCWTRTGYVAAGRSNLYVGNPGESNSDKIEAYLDDWGGPNHRVGHRRWLLYPPLAAVAIAGTTRANVTTVLGSPVDTTAPEPPWVAWPSAGWFPSRLDPRGRWSLSSGADDADFSHATVTVTYQGRPVDVRLRPVDNGAARPTLVWEMPATWPSRPVGRADVTVSDVVVGGTATRAAYTIRFFRTR